MTAPVAFARPDLTPRQRFAAGAVEGASAVALGVALFAAWTGGWRAELFGLTLSVRAVSRPVLVAAALLVLRWLLLRDRAARFAQLSDAGARVVAGTVLTVGLLSWTTSLSPYAGGADSYGYVSAAERLRDGELIQPEPLAALLSYPDAIRAATPLGYVPAARVPGASAPAYPLGLPAMMALSASVAGTRAPFYVPLVMGWVLVAASAWMTYRWTRDPLIALTASAAVAFHPVVFAYAIQAMSDVPATALYLLAAACLMTDRTGFALTGGVAAGAAFLIRPALLPGVAALGLIPLVARNKRWHRIGVFGAILVTAVALQAWLQWYLYGSPFANGYGGAGELFAFRHLALNARSYGYWGVVMHGPIWVIGFTAGLFVLRETSARAVLVAAIVAAVFPYAVYRPYDHWETLRFLLPLLVVGTLYAVAGLFMGTPRRLGHHTRAWLGLLLTTVTIAFWVRWLDSKHVFNLARAEERFEQAAQLVERSTPDNAVVLASLHSGSVRYYAHRQTMNWGSIPEGQFDATVAALEARGLPVFVMLDGQEERSAFETRHGRVLDRGGWLPAGQRRDIQLYEAPR